MAFGAVRKMLVYGQKGEGRGWDVFYAYSAWPLGDLPFIPFRLLVDETFGRKGPH